MRISSGTGSSQPRFFRQSSWRIDLPSKRTGATKPRRSNIELTVERMPHLVQGRSFRAIMNLNTSALIDHCTPSARSVKWVSQSKFRFFTSSARSASGISSRTFRLFDVNLCRLNPPRLHISFASWTSCTASSAVGIDFKPSST